MNGQAFQAQTLWRVSRVLLADVAIGIGAAGATAAPFWYVGAFAVGDTPRHPELDKTAIQGAFVLFLMLLGLLVAYQSGRDVARAYPTSRLEAFFAGGFTAGAGYAAMIMSLVLTYVVLFAVTRGPEDFSLVLVALAAAPAAAFVGAATAALYAPGFPLVEASEIAPVEERVHAPELTRGILPAPPRLPASSRRARLSDLEEPRVGRRER